MSESRSHTLLDLTRDFINILINSKGAEVDLNTASDRLVPPSIALRCHQCPYRYWSDRTVWERQSQMDWQRAVDDGGQLKELLDKEAKVDRMISVIEEMFASLSQSSEFQNFAWVSENECHCRHLS
jgi:hypothetical protein